MQDQNKLFIRIKNRAGKNPSAPVVGLKRREVMKNCHLQSDISSVSSQFFGGIFGSNWHTRRCYDVGSEVKKNEKS
jgi:hypothetical protein